jgi:hypothetical protein
MITYLLPGLPDLSWYNIPKRGEICQITTYDNIPNGQKIYQMARKYSKCLGRKYTKPPEYITNGQLCALIGKILL